MDICTNCGGALRPGAKFCTSCGTRINTPVTASSWGDTAAGATESRETTMLHAVSSDSQDPESTSIKGKDSDASSWSDAWSTPSTATSSMDPAGRFITELDEKIESVDESLSRHTDTTPAFVPPAQSSWSYGYSANEDTSANSDVSGADGGSSRSDESWRAQSTWNVPSVPSTPENADAKTLFDSEKDAWVAPETMAAWAAEDKEASENTTQWQAPATWQDATGKTGSNLEDASNDTSSSGVTVSHSRVTELLDELRSLVGSMRNDNVPDREITLAVLNDQRESIGDYGDLAALIAKIKANPGDSAALAQLGENIDQLESLLAEHKSLSETITSTINDLSL